MFKRLIFILTVIGVQITPLNVTAQWVEGGVQIYDYQSWCHEFEVTSDSLGGALYAWRDNSGFIKAQRLDRDGYLLWYSGGMPVCEEPVYDSDLEIVSDGKGGGIIVWQDQRDGDQNIYMQRLQADGYRLWDQEGLAVCSVPGAQWFPDLISDGCGGAIVVWTDTRDNTVDFYIQRVDSNGVELWPSGGMRFSSPGVVESTFETLAGAFLEPDGYGGAFIVWAKSTIDFDEYVHAQRISADGDLLWGEIGVNLSTDNYWLDEDWYSSIAVGPAGAVFVWRRDAGLADVYKDIYTQMVTYDGSIAWDSAGVGILVSPDIKTYSPSATWIDESNVVIVWTDTRAGERLAYAQKLDLFGSKQWGGDGMRICHDSSGQFQPQVLQGSDDDLIVTWLDQRDERYRDIYVQRLSLDGSLLWDPNGVHLHHYNGYSGLYNLSITTDAEGGGIVSWSEERADITRWLFAKRIMNTGEVPVPTFLQEYFTEIRSDAILLKWTVSDFESGGVFIVERMNAASLMYSELARLSVVVGEYGYSYSDKSTLPGKAYAYRVLIEEEDDTRILFETDFLILPSAHVTLYQNYPNPFNPSTIIEYFVPSTSIISLDIYDVGGRHVKRIVEKIETPGTHKVSWDGRDSNDNEVSSGVYIYKLRAGKETYSKKMLVLR